MLLNCAADLSLLSIEVAEHQPDLGRVGIDLRRAFELLDRQIDLTGDEVVETEDEVGRLADSTPIDPFALHQLVAFPGFARSQAGEQADEHAEQDAVAAHYAPPIA